MRTFFGCCILFTIFVADPCFAQNGATYLVNTGDEKVLYALSWREDVPQPSGGKNKSKIAWHRPDKIKTRAWYGLAPGSTVGFSPSHLVHAKGVEINEKGEKFFLPVIGGELTQIQGDNFPKKKGNTYKSESGVKADWLRFTKVSPRYYYARTGRKKYDLKSETFKYDFSSRDHKTFRKSFFVPGQIQFFTESSKGWSYKRTFKKNGPNLELSGHTVGKNTGANKYIGPFSTGRDPGYFRGSVTVYYLTRLAKDSMGGLLIENSYGGEIEIFLYDKNSDRKKWTIDGGESTNLSSSGKRISVRGDRKVQVVFGNGVKSPKRPIHEIGKFDSDKGKWRVKATDLFNGK